MYLSIEGTVLNRMSGKAFLMGTFEQTSKECKRALG